MSYIAATDWGMFLKRTWGAVTAFIVLNCCFCGCQPADGIFNYEDRASPIISEWVAPTYPREAQAAGLADTVVVRVRVLAAGEVDAIEIIDSDGYALLDEAAVASVRQCAFLPAIQGGKAYDSWLEMNCYFPPNLVDGVPCDSVTANPRIVHWAKPDYPMTARQHLQEGTVIVKVLVLSDGTVGSAELMNGPGYKLMENSAINAARDCVFEPGVLDCIPAQAWMALPFNFRLGREVEE